MLVLTTEIKITYHSCYLCVSVCSLGAVGGDLGKLWVSEFLSLWNGVTVFAKFSLVKGRTFANPAVHPHPNYMGIPPGKGSTSTF